MDAERIRQLRRADPFLPFTLVMQDGSRYAVRQSYHLGLSPDGRALMYSAPDGSTMTLAASAVADVVVESPPSEQVVMNVQRIR